MINEQSCVSLRHTFLECSASLSAAWLANLVGSLAALAAHRPFVCFPPQFCQAARFDWLLVWMLVSQLPGRGGAARPGRPASQPAASGVFCHHLHSRCKSLLPEEYRLEILVPLMLLNTPLFVSNGARPFTIKSERGDQVVLIKSSCFAFR